METRISVVVPVYNEGGSLPTFHARLADVLEAMETSYEIIYVDDGSSDETHSRLTDIVASGAHSRALILSRNFGKESAMTAGLDAAAGAFVVVIDADLQDPPELIPELYEKVQAGYDCVYATRASRAGETAFKKATSALFYRLLNRLSPLAIPRDTGDFRIMNRAAADALRRLRERRRFMKGLFAWIGFRQTGIEYSRDPRFDGATKWNYLKLTDFAIEGITSFSVIPLRFATLMGLLVAGFSFLYGLVVIVKTLLFGDPVAGYPSLMTVILFLGGVQLLALGIIGEYLGRLFDEAKARPLYLIRETLEARKERQADD